MRNVNKGPATEAGAAVPPADRPFTGVSELRLVLPAAALAGAAYALIRSVAGACIRELARLTVAEAAPPTPAP